MVNQHLPLISETLKARNILSTSVSIKKDKLDDVHVKAFKDTLLLNSVNPEIKKDFSVPFNNNFKV